MDGRELLTIGAVAERAGIAASALRYYDREGIVTSIRSPGGQRRYPRSALRRIAFIRAAQNVGLSLDEIREALSTLPEGRTPTAADWARLSRVVARRASTSRSRRSRRCAGGLSSCIGCGCLSLADCALMNPDDTAGRAGLGRPLPARAAAAAARGRAGRGVAPSNTDATAARSGPLTMSHSVVRTCETVPTRSPAGLWMPMRAPT